MSSVFSGAGPGIQTSDGCSVELYRRLPNMGELEDLIPQLPVGGSVLELGCGTGRLCARLAELGFRVTGVDESSDMLAVLPPTVTLLVEAVLRSKGSVSMTLRYELSGQTWRQSFSTVPLSEVEVEELLGRSGFAQIRWHGGARLWASAIAQ